MKIAIVSQYYYPEQFKINEITSSLVDRGHEVFVLTGLPNYPTGIVPNEYINGKRHEWINGVEVFRSFEIGRKKGLFPLVANYLSFAISASINSYKLSKIRDFDVVLVYQLSPITLVLPAIVLAKMKKKKVLMYCLDLWPESILMVLKTKGWIYKLVHWLSKNIYQSMDRILVSSESFIDYLNSVNHVESKRMEYCPQHHSFIEIEKKLHPDCVNYLYAGNMGKAQPLKPFIEAFSKVNSNIKYQVHFVGDGSEKKLLVEYVNQLRLQDRIQFHGHMSQEEVNQFYEIADVSLMSLSSETSIGATLPSKLIGYCAAGLPILAMIGEPSKSLILDNHLGWVSDIGDVETLRMHIEYTLSHRDKLNNFGINAKSYFLDHFTKEVFLDKIEFEMRNMLGDSHV